MKKLFSSFIILVLLFTSILQVSAAGTEQLFSESKYGWSVKLANDYVKDITVIKENEISYFSGDYQNSFSVNTYSLSGLTLDSWFNRDMQYLKDNYNPAYYSVVKTESGKLGAYKCKKVTLKILNASGWIIRCNVYITSKNYRYLVSYSMPAADYSVASKKAVMEKYLTSFKFTEPNPSKLGDIKENQAVYDSKTKNKLSSKEFGWAFDLPNTWRINVNSGKSVIYDIDNHTITADLFVEESAGKSLDEQAKSYEASLSNGIPILKVSKKVTIKSKDTDVLFYTLANDSSKARTYLFIANGKTYKFTFVMLKYADTAKNNKILDDIWNSFKTSAAATSATTGTSTGENVTDYAALLGKITKGKAGDSYYGWSVNIPSNFSLLDRTFDGRFTTFLSTDKNSGINVMIIKNEKNQNLDSILTSVVNNYKKTFTILVSEKRSVGSQEYAVVAYRSEKDKFVNEHRFFIKGNTIYSVAVSQPEEAYAKGMYNSVLDSFATSFPKDNSANDLSNVEKNGLRLYSNVKFGWFIGVLPDWNADTLDSKGNCASFYYDDKNSIFVNMYSKEAGLTLDKYVENELARMNRVYNKQLTTISQPEDITISGLKCKRINLTFTVNGGTFYKSFIMYVGNNYRYTIGYALDSNGYNSVSIKSGVDKMMSSFMCVEPSVTTVGKLFDSENENQSTTGRSLSSTKFKWSVTIPSSFVEGENNQSEDQVQYTNDVSLYDFSMDVYTAKKSLDEYAASNEKYMQTNPGYTIISSETLTEKDTTVRKVVYKYAEKGDTLAYYNINYTLCKNGYFYDIYFSVPEYRYTDYSNQVFQSIWDSMKFQ